KVETRRQSDPTGDSENEALANSDEEGDEGQKTCSAQGTSRTGNTSKRPNVARRIERNKSVSNSTVKMSLGAFLTYEGKLLLKFESILEDMNRGISECYNLLNYHVLRLRAEGRVVPPFERNYICRFFSAVTVGGPDIMEFPERYNVVRDPNADCNLDYKYRAVLTARSYVVTASSSLKQAASAWNKTIHRVFLRNGFKSCGADQCVYVNGTRNGFVYLCLYVDDMTIVAKTCDEIREVKEALKIAFKMKELGDAKLILAMVIDYDRTAGTLMIKQTRYIDDVVERFNQRDAKPVENPCTSNMKLSKALSPSTETECAEMQSLPHRSLIGCLMYITTCTRPEIVYVVTQLSRFLENPGLQHWKRRFAFSGSSSRLLSTASCINVAPVKSRLRRIRTRLGEQH
ncbi:hypothetical protein JG688_00017499, partial [Phytophthora aleatoria]